MSRLRKSIVAWTLISGTAFAQVPSNNDVSDTNQNTGSGTGALGGPNVLAVGASNSAIGYQSLYYNTTGSDNVAIGVNALHSNTSGNQNLAIGSGALNSNATGNNSTAAGYNALYSSSASEDTAFGSAALFYNTTGSANTAVGPAALYLNTTGTGNTAIGDASLRSNTTADNNTALGYGALLENNTGSSNTASGRNSMITNTTGQSNTASGFQSLYFNSTGNYNTAVGDNALYSNSSGSNNIGVGSNAGYSLTTGANNIDIGNEGVAADGGVIRIGTIGTQTSAYIAGVHSKKITGSAVYVTAKGELGVLASSERYKTEIKPMNQRSAGVLDLKPVTFHLKTDPDGPIQYGLVAEDVAKSNPELIIRDDSGQIEGVRYEELAPMLIHEVQQQRAELKYLREQMARLLAQTAPKLPP